MEWLREIVAALKERLRPTQKMQEVGSGNVQVGNSTGPVSIHHHYYAGDARPEPDERRAQNTEDDATEAMRLELLKILRDFDKLPMGRRYLEPYLEKHFGTCHIRSMDASNVPKALKYARKAYEDCSARSAPQKTAGRV